MREWQRSKLQLALATAVFRVSLVTFLLLIAIDFFEPGFVSNWFNPLRILLLVMISGTMSHGSET